MKLSLGKTMIISFSCKPPVRRLITNYVTILSHVSILLNISELYPIVRYIFIIILITSILIIIVYYYYFITVYYNYYCLNYSQDRRVEKIV
jgi:hypothetical protein